jgi:hypothetical protein
MLGSSLAYRTTCASLCQVVALDRLPEARGSLLGTKYDSQEERKDDVSSGQAKRIEVLSRGRLRRGRATILSGLDRRQYVSLWTPQRRSAE